ncbi:L,D-transpeptidase family protein [Paenibacillus sp. OV219]|uniref:L,D-transpeptidase family protein n=1 Tax=Paenibacillus sp. OV219 TaxID=1884377 RepID=UPI00210BB4FB|nr:L,D-transpeptidase family protein [Paenibacillus sp. OV219]
MLTILLAFIGVFLVPVNTNAAGSKNELIIVNKGTNKLAFYIDGELVKTFSVGTGRSPDLTPEGSFKIVNKIKNRPYYKDHIAGGDPTNPLGDRWLGLQVGATYGTTYAIHGNNNSKSIGKYVSAGCIRMLNDEIHWLYPQIVIGTKVIVTTSKLDFATIAEQNDYPVTHYFAGSLLLDGKSVKLDHELLMMDSRVFIPMREVFELLGAQVGWDEQTKTVTAIIGSRTITHKALTGTVSVGGSTVAITSSRIVDNSLLLPLRDITELIGHQVDWDGTKKQIRITS